MPFFFLLFLVTFSSFSYPSILGLKFFCWFSLVYKSCIVEKMITDQYLFPCILPPQARGKRNHCFIDSGHYSCKKINKWTQINMLFKSCKLIISINHPDPGICPSWNKSPCSHYLSCFLWSSQQLLHLNISLSFSKELIKASDLLFRLIKQLRKKSLFGKQTWRIEINLLLGTKINCRYGQHSPSQQSTLLHSIWDNLNDEKKMGQTF